MKDNLKPDKRRKYDAAFCAEALRLAEQNRSAQAAARAQNIDPKRIYQWQKVVQTVLAAALVVSLDPATAAELRQLRAINRRQAQELVIEESHRQQTLEACYLADAGPMSRYRLTAAGRGHYPVRRLCQGLGVPASGFHAW